MPGVRRIQYPAGKEDRGCLCPCSASGASDERWNTQSERDLCLILNTRQETSGGSRAVGTATENHKNDIPAAFAEIRILAEALTDMTVHVNYQPRSGTVNRMAWEIWDQAADVEKLVDSLHEQPPEANGDRPNEAEPDSTPSSSTTASDVSESDAQVIAETMGRAIDQPTVTITEEHFEQLREITFVVSLLTELIDDHAENG